ncbi:MAG: hypothetical protein PHX38_04445 [Sulfuricella sp.]|nr:hypothetical protein [Sulfuricella sp.]
MAKRSNCLACGALLALLAAPATAQEMQHDMSMHAPAAAAKDQRTAIVLTTAERAIVLQEMRDMLGGTQSVVAGLANDDMKAVASAARPLGMHVMHGVPVSLKAKLPMGFKQMGMAMHSDFDQIALDAESLGDPKHTLKQMDALLQKCVACHGIYQIQPAVK